mmetsp:Transcript_85862/g.171838  ORF Transcript_85862/g.171838 Transcript_85862/m.171838 type:complete len:202 (-) Transcript_85862:59-664(-)
MKVWHTIIQILRIHHSISPKGWRKTCFKQHGIGRIKMIFEPSFRDLFFCLNRSHMMFDFRRLLRAILIKCGERSISVCKQLTLLAEVLTSSVGMQCVHAVAIKSKLLSEQLELFNSFVFGAHHEANTKARVMIDKIDRILVALKACIRKTLDIGTNVLTNEFTTFRNVTCSLVAGSLDFGLRACVTTTMCICVTREIETVN